MTKDELLTKKFSMICLGCDKNRVDAEKMKFMLTDYGFDYTDNLEQANFVIVNTCAFIGDAKQESIDTILQVAQFKQQGLEKLIVTGCLAQRYTEEIKKGMPEIDVVVRLKNNENIVKVVEGLFGFDGNAKQKNKKSKSLARVLSTPFHYAYLKIADGCNNCCSYCTIPHIRGRYTSVPPQDVIKEANQLVKNGVRELILVAQDVTNYGSDLFNKPVLVELLRELSKIKKLKWIRLHYCYPNLITDELLNEIATNPKVCKYIDIPMQHASDNVLKMMNRKDTLKDYENLLDKIRNLPEFVAVRSTFIVGFPGESKTDFNTLKTFLQNQKMQYVGFFKYSREEHTVAHDLPHQINEKTKQARYNEIASLQQQLMLQSQQSFVGKTVCAVCEQKQDDKYILRSEYNSPNVDTIVYVDSPKSLKIGEFYNVKIVGLEGIDLKGEIL
ncbi:MAG: 30S ribosomal protein S12 methylthiotransferase RimO [Christensenellales bacterium]